MGQRNNIIIGTRPSRLALCQTQVVVDALVAAGVAPDSVVIKPIRTSSDATGDRPLYDIGGKGLFVKEIDEQLLAGEIDLAVHSLKDVPTQLVPGVVLSSFLPRAASVSDVLLLKRHTLDELGAEAYNELIERQAEWRQCRVGIEGAASAAEREIGEGDDGCGGVVEDIKCEPEPVLTWLAKKFAAKRKLRIATCSRRRAALIMLAFVGESAGEMVEVPPMRGNVDSRVKKLLDGDLDAIVLARCGLTRLQVELDPREVVALELDPAVYIPAAGQGVIVVATRLDGGGDAGCREVLQRINCRNTQLQAAAERAVLAAIAGDCYTPVGCVSEVSDGGDNSKGGGILGMDECRLVQKRKLLRLRGFLANFDYSEIVAAQVTGFCVGDEIESAVSLGDKLGQRLKERLQ